MDLVGQIKTVVSDARRADSMSSQTGALVDQKVALSAADRAISGAGVITRAISNMPNLVTGQVRNHAYHASLVLKMAGSNMKGLQNYALSQAGARLGMSGTQLGQSVRGAVSIANDLGAGRVASGMSNLLGSFLDVGAMPYQLELSGEKGLIFRFSADRAPYDRLRRVAEYLIGEQNRIGRASSLQATGIAPQTLEITGSIFLGMHGAGHLDTLRKLATTLKPVTLTTGYGEVWGRWYIKQVSEEQLFTFTDGAPRKQQFTVSLSSYGEDYTNV